ncbi:MAG: SDR family oxidoreductase [Deltaproteobacteria bacterium]|nr:SDR family oxidoreductase [Deltaproteobacteria bacterium]
MLKGKKALVTGGSQGIGASIAKALLKQGAEVAITCKNEAREGDWLIGQAKAMDLKAYSVQCEVSSFREVGSAVESAVESLGGLDILINNAGMNWDGVLWKMSEEQWDWVIAVNLKGYFNFCRHVVPIFKEQRSGKIINITSINGLRGKFGQSNYSASKAGIVGLTKSLARELGAFSVNVNAVAPGLIDSPMLSESPAKEAIITQAMEELVIKRIGTPEDIANGVVFLASEMARHITGQVLKVDGGQYI